MYPGEASEDDGVTLACEALLYAREYSGMRNCESLCFGHHA